jgi:hypothetical protein
LLDGFIRISISIPASRANGSSLVLGCCLESLLFQVQPRDPVTPIAAAPAILLFSPPAIAIPSLRATRVDCTVALQSPEPGSSGLAQWQVGFPQRLAAAQLEPGRKSPRSPIWRKILRAYGFQSRQRVGHGASFF